MFTPSRLLMIRFPQILVQVGVKGLARVTMLTTFCLSLALTVSHVVEHFVRLEVDGGVVGMVGYDYFKTLTPRLYDQKAIVDKAHKRYPYIVLPNYEGLDGEYVPFRLLYLGAETIR